jgi:hypothetical protein
MTGKLTLPFIFILFFILSCKNKGSDNQNDLDSDSTKFFQKEKKDIIAEIKAANRKFKVSDSDAFKLLKNIKEISELLNTEFVNKNISNELVIEGVPLDSDPIWSVQLRQVQTGNNRTIVLLFFTVDANNGQIKVMDNFLKPGQVLNLDEWLKLKNQK